VSHGREKTWLKVNAGLLDESSHKRTTNWWSCLVLDYHAGLANTHTFSRTFMISGLISIKEQQINLLIYLTK